jgi:hypothetical protein
VRGNDRLRQSGEETDAAATASTSQYGVGIFSTTHQEGEVPSTSGLQGAAASISDPQRRDDSSSTNDDEFQTDVEEEDIHAGSTVTCPLSKIKFRHCNWCETLSTLQNHVTECHADIIRRCSTFHCKATEDTALLILYRGEVFLYYKRLSYSGHMHVFVQQVGLTNRTYTCKVQIQSRGESEDINRQFDINRITETFEVAMDLGRCISIDSKAMEIFVSNYEIDMVVTIKEIRKRKRTRTPQP